MATQLQCSLPIPYSTEYTHRREHLKIKKGACIQSKSIVATVCGIEWNVYAAAFTPQNGAIVRTDSVRTKAYLQNSETCMRNLHW